MTDKHKPLSKNSHSPVANNHKPPSSNNPSKVPSQPPKANHPPLDLVPYQLVS